MRDLIELADAVDLVVSRSRDVVSARDFAQLVGGAAVLRQRRGFFGETLLLAIAGGTGSGKSSLLNAIAGEPIASVSHLRPHTDEPLAWLPENAEPGLRVHIDELAVERRVTQDQMPGVALVDLPDLDSVAAWHRRTVEDLLPKVDGVIWVFDPEKYGDRSLHQDFLRRLSDHRDQFVFALNKADLIEDGDLGGVVDDLVGLLDDDGYPGSAPFVVAANPSDGKPRGIEDLAGHIETGLDAKRMAATKFVTDAEQLLRTVGETTGLWGGSDLELETRWQNVREHAAAGLCRAGGAAAREDALCRIEDLVAGVAVEAGGELGTSVRRKFDREVLEAAVTAAAHTAPPAVEVRRWFRTRVEAGIADPTEAESVLEAAIGGPLRAMLEPRARLAATIAYAGVGTYELRDSLGGR